MSFSKIRLEPPTAELFAPPNDFTKYDSAEAMVAELVMRQRNLKLQPNNTAEPSSIIISATKSLSEPTPRR